MKFPLRSITLAICASALSTSLQLQAGTVTNTDDSGPGSLRAAIAAAPPGATIDFAPALNGATITLTSGHLSITGLQVTIDASALPAGIKISGNNSSRILTILSGSNVILKHLEMINGRAFGNNGGALLAEGGQLSMTNCSISGSFASYNGGGAWIGFGAQATLDRCSFLGNHSNDYGGGIFLGQNTTVVTLTNSIISGNQSSNGGGLCNFSTSPSIINCTIQGNSGSGIQLEFASAPLLRNTIVWGNRSGAGTTASQQIQKGASSSANADVDYCLIEGASKTLNNLNGTSNPNFVNPVDSTTSPSPSADLRVFTNSPVLNAGNNGSTSTLLDRAGKTRVQNTTIDLGAFEGGYVTFGRLHPSLNPIEDSNGNGISNFLEYASGTDPSGPDNPASRPMMSRSGDSNFLTTSQRSNSVDVIFSWETSTSMETLSWQNMVWGIHYTVESTSSPSPDRQQMIYKLLDNDSRRFYRQGYLSN